MTHPLENPALAEAARSVAAATKPFAAIAKSIAELTGGKFAGLRAPFISIAPLLTTNSNGDENV